MTKVAIPVTDNMLSHNFTDCAYYLIYEIGDTKIIDNTTEFTPEKQVEGIKEWTRKWNITDIITRDIDQISLRYFADTKINLFVGVPISSPGKLIEQYLDGTLKSDTGSVSGRNLT